MVRSLLWSQKFTPKWFSTDDTENSILVAFHCFYVGDSKCLGLHGYFVKPNNET